LGKSNQVVVIDHHRRSEHFIKNPLLVYIEPAASSTSELVTELLMYFEDNLLISRLDATALYSGIVVDTKNFAVQTGVRTFDAAAYLRRSGADPVMVRHLFRTDYETTVALAEAKARSKLYPGGLIVSSCPELRANGQVIAAQAADSLLRIEDVRMSIVVFQLSEDTVGLSARSTGELNVQVIMEFFGGGGHQNVAGAQVKGEPLEEILERVVDVSQDYIKEYDSNESNTESGRKEAGQKG
jgi:c-di-AMP phosphodiesterase-like protein